MSKTNTIHSSIFIRPSPDLNPPNAPSHLTYTLITSLAYLVYLIIIPIYVPYLTIIHFLTPRPFPSWTLDRRISTRLNKLWVTLTGWWIPPLPADWDDWEITPPGEPYIEAQKKGEIELKEIRLDPVGKDYIKGIAEVEQVKGEIRPGFWIDPLLPLSKGGVGQDKVILHIHGGGYIRGHPLWTPFPMGISKSTGVKCLSVNYRKALSPSSSFPAPLLDVLSAYIYLTRKIDIAPRNIILLGESAGAHLALMLTQYLRDLSLPQIGYLILSSPWSDFTLSYPSYKYNSGYCQLSPIRLGQAVKSAARYYYQEFLQSGYASPAKMMAGGWKYLKEEGTEVYVHYGGRELFKDEIEELGRGMNRDGVDVRMRLDPDGLHTSGMNGEAGEVFKKDVLEILDIQND
ncbi:hypothetical protein L486_00750 [Kwoniella mangroviensis CBS 10435]|uniref:Alpha/beta hydrolase fold-3 domain-containing protein n=1 Tax=Kwoniella mangroviensis CBS 10435 TaxID=1331196 RepID=A0A1B9J001_9TREE|nr:hypothetical protein L486_00750 [Kwoniella mangroviensis CBS 10435]